MFKCSLLIFALLIANSFAPLPTFIKKCNQKDPNINDCLVKNANLALPYLYNGSKELKIPNLSPLFIPHVEQASSNIKFSIDNVTIHGFDTLTLSKSTADFVKKIGTMELKGKHFEVNGIYDIKGRILILPIVGHGPINVKLDNVEYKFIFDFDFIQKNGVTHGKLLKTRFDWDAGKSVYKLDNLFNGDPTLGPEMNKFLNENPKVVNQELGFAVAEAIKKIVDNMFANLVDNYSFNEMFE